MNEMISLAELVKLLERLDKEEKRLQALVEKGNNLLSDVTDLCITQKYKSTIQEIISFVEEKQWVW